MMNATDGPDTNTLEIVLISSSEQIINVGIRDAQLGQAGEVQFSKALFVRIAASLAFPAPLPFDFPNEPIGVIKV